MIQYGIVLHSEGWYNTVRDGFVLEGIVWDSERWHGMMEDGMV